jgi:repressor LexA
MRDHTLRQRLVLQAIADSLRTSGYPPTIRELGVTLGIRSTNGVNDHLKALERKGLIERDLVKSRAMSVTAAGWALLGEEDSGAGPSRESAVLPAREEAVTVPLLGRIAAGSPLEALADAEERLHVDPALLGRASEGEVFALRVQGESMIGDGILDGDIIVVRRQSVARQGELVAVMVDGAATVKRLYRERDGRVRLQPSNDAMAPIVVSESEARETVVLGRVIALYRNLERH